MTDKPNTTPTPDNVPYTLVYTRMVFFQNSNTTLLERQVNYFLTYAPLASLHKTESNVTDDGILITLWFEPMPGATQLDRVYEEALALTAL